MFISNPKKTLNTFRHSRGMSLVELLVILAILSIVVSIAIMNLRSFGNDLENAAQETSAFFKQARIRAINTTSAYRVVFESDTRLRAEYAVFCDDDEGWEHEPQLDLVLREDVVMDDADFDAEEVLLCFNSRGIANEDTEVLLRDKQGREKIVEVYMGGGVLIQ